MILVNKSLRLVRRESCFARDSARSWIDFDSLPIGGFAGGIEDDAVLLEFFDVAGVMGDGDLDCRYRVNADD